MRIVFDIEANNLLNHESVDYTSIPYKLKEEYKVHCIVAKDIDTGEVYAFYEGEDIRFEDIEYKRFGLGDWKEFLKGVTQVVGHNIIDYDLPVVELYFGIQYEIGPDMLDGRSVRIDDTLVLSKLLNPDRFGGHSLESWGRRVGLDKIKFGDGSEEQWETFTPEMLRYCIRDVEVNTRTLDALRKEWGNWKWNDAYQLEKKVAEVIFRQKHFGFKFDVELGEWCYDDLAEKMTAIEGRVEPLLPEKPISKTNAKDFCPPRQQFKKDGSMSSHMERFLEKHGGEVTEFDTAIKGVRKQVEIIQPKQVKIYNQLFNLPMDPDAPIVDKEPMKLSHQTEIKQHLMELGWVPTVWKEKDLSIDSSKRKLTGEKFEQAVERYVESTLGTPFEEARSEKLKCDPRELRRKLMDHNMNKPLKVYTSPSFTVDQDKNLCPNLINLGEKVAYVKEIVEWLTYRHRRNAIYSPAENSASKTKDTGWLTNPRLEVDGRIPTPADTNGCNTARFQHRDVANVPRCSSLYGEHMRALFGAGEGYKQIGYDADGLEARIEGHYTMRYPGGKKYAESLVAEKPNDVHTQTKNKIIEITGIEDFTRDSAKTVKYACLPTDNTQVLTPKGWKNYTEISVGDEVFGMDPSTKTLVKTVVEQKHFYENAEIVKLENNLFSVESTPDHRWFGWKRAKGKEIVPTFFTTEDINTEYNILAGGKCFEIGNKVTPKQASVVGWLLSDGYYKWSEESEGTSTSFGAKRGIKMSFGQDEGKYLYTLMDDLEQAGLDFTRTVDGSFSTLTVKSSSARDFMDSVCESRKNKHEYDWVSWVCALSPEARKSFLYKFWLADGDSKGKSFYHDTLTFSQNCGNVAEALKVALLLEGRRVTDNKKSEKCRTIRGVWKKHLTMQRVTKTFVENKDVFCLTTTAGTFVIRQGNYYGVTGNCAYGAQPPKLASQNGWPMDIAKAVFNGYWEAAAPLASLKKAVTHYWKTTGEKKFIIGLDGRKLLTRSEHSLVNVLFQSAGVICMKRAMVILEDWLKKEDLTINVFRDTIEGKQYTLQMIAYHDEGQNAVTEGLVKTKVFEDEDSAKTWKAAQEQKTGKILSDVGHIDDKHFVAYCRVGELAAKSITAGGEYYNLKVPLTAGYMVGNNWADCH